MKSELDIILYKLNKFSKKYFLNQIITGLMLFILVSFVFWLVFLGLEYFLYFSINTKFYIVTSFFVFSIISFIFLIFLPFLKYCNVLKGLSKVKINQLITQSFPDVKDKLINILELSSSDTDDVYSKELIVASINQKITDIKIFDFNKAISFKRSFKFLYLVFGAFVLSFLFYLVNPRAFNDTSYRLIKYQTTFEKPLPYKLTILNEDLSVGKGEDFTLHVSIGGYKEYSDVNLIISGKSFLMKKDSTNFYSYKFNNVNNDLFFQVSINNYNSSIYQLIVHDKPILTNFSVQLTKPGYTLQKNEKIDNVTEFTVPAGTVATVDFSTLNTDSVILSDGSSKFSLDNSKKNIFIYKKQIIDNQYINVNLKNSNFFIPDYLKINFQVIEDQFPSIGVVKLNDSIDFTRIYFRGNVTDDYGFSKLLFQIKIGDKIDSTFILNILPNVSTQEFFYAFDFNLYKSITKDLSYFFEIYDNDEVKGPKSAVSETFYFSFPEANEIADFQDKMFDQIENIFQNSMNFTDQLKNNLNEVKKKMLNSDLTEWERKEIQKNISSIKGNLEEELKNLIEKNDEMNNYMKSFTEQDQRLIEKQQQINDLLEDVFSDEMKKLLEDFNKMMQEFNKDQLNNSKEKLDLSVDELSKQLDRNLELLKRMKVEQQLDQFSKNIDNLIKKQDSNLSEADKKFDTNKLASDQEKQQKDFDQLMKEYNDINKINNELEEPVNLYDLSNEKNEINNEFSKSNENIRKENKKKSQESLKKNKENLDNLKFMIDQMIEENFAEQNMENLQDLIQILDNLVTFSFNQEKLISSTNKRNFNVLALVEQKKLVNDFTIINDSLYSLSKREPSINSQINKELFAVRTYFAGIENDFEDNAISQINVNQQKVLTSVNNLSLFLSEVIKKLQEQQANSQPGNKNCNKPGNNPNPNSMKSSMQSMQKSLQQQLEKIMQMMKQGDQGKAMQNELGKAISQQEAMHNMLQQMMNQGQVGSNAYETLKQADQLLDKVREDILRNNISNSTIERQKQIMTRLLEAEKAENERDLEEKRKSDSAKEQFLSKPNTKLDDERFQINYEEKLLKNKLILNSFYQSKFQKYMFTLDSINGKVNQHSILEK